MKFLVDECLSPELTKLAHAKGYGKSAPAKEQSPRPEEARQRRLEGRPQTRRLKPASLRERGPARLQALCSWPSFETRAGRAPQDEADFFTRSQVMIAWQQGGSSGHFVPSRAASPLQLT
jgi:hypothetical protein